jgi:hypothetical protein
VLVGTATQAQKRTNRGAFAPRSLRTPNRYNFAPKGESYFFLAAFFLRLGAAFFFAAFFGAFFFVAFFATLRFFAMMAPFNG